MKEVMIQRAQIIKRLAKDISELPDETVEALANMECKRCESPYDAVPRAFESPLNWDKFCSFYCSKKSKEDNG